jgi:hypothetical protein
MIAGYALFFVIGAIYLGSLALRRRNLEADLRTLEAIQAEARRAPASGSKTLSRSRAKPSGAGAPARRKIRKKVTRRK